MGENTSALIGAFVTIAVMTSILLRRRRRRTDVLFVILCVTLLLWFIATFFSGYTEAWTGRAELATAALIPAALLRLFAEMVPLTSAKGRSLAAAAYPLSGVIAAAAISPLGDTQYAQVAVAVYVSTVVLLASNSMIKATDLDRGTVEYVRRRYVAIGASLVTLLAIIGELPQLGLSFNAMGHLSVMLYVFFLSQVILRDRLLDLNEFIGRMVVMGILAVLFATMFAILISLGSRFSDRLFTAIVGVMILLTLYEPLKVRLEGKTIELFFRERHRFVQTLEDLRRRMHHGVIDPARMATIAVDTLYDARRATHAAIYFLDPTGGEFVLRAHRGPRPPSRVNAETAPALWLAIQQNRAPLLTERLAAESGEDETRHRDLIEQMRTVGADVLLPFVSGETVLGFLALRDDRSPESYSTAEIATLMQIAETGATVVWNSKLAERHRERERLATVGAMAAGLAHEIRNPLGAIKGAAEYLDPDRLSEGDEAEFLQVIIDETNRLNSVVSQFLDYARPFRATFEQTDLNEVVRKTAKLVEAEHGESRVDIQLDERTPPISADGEQIKQVVLNLARNGLDASRDAEAPVSITTRFVPERNCVELRVRDQGGGIPQEDLERIFIPFFTTKQSGTGLGLAVCQRIVLNHGGTIHPESTVGQGTQFVVVLPVARAEHGSITGSYSRPPLPPLEPTRRRPRKETPLPAPVAPGSVEPT